MKFLPDALGLKGLHKMFTTRKGVVCTRPRFLCNTYKSEPPLVVG
jgi:hypothetical protein